MRELFKQSFKSHVSFVSARKRVYMQVRLYLYSCIRPITTVIRVNMHMYICVCKCKIVSDSISQPLPCPEEQWKIDDACYLYDNAGRTFNEAKAYCRAQSMYLPEFHRHSSWESFRTQWLV